MNPQEIEKLYHMPFSLLAKVCKDEKTLAEVITMAIHMGINIGQREVIEAYNEMFRGYNKVSIEN